MARAKELGCMVGFDINYRNLIWKDDKDACTRKVLSVLKYVDFLKLSDEEIDMVGGHDKVPDVMKEYDIAVAVLTLGGDGAEVFYDGKILCDSGFPGQSGGYHRSRRRVLGRLLILRPESRRIFRGSAERGAASGGSPVWQCERFPVRTAEGRISSLPTREQVEQFLAEHKN